MKWFSSLLLVLSLSPSALAVHGITVKVEETGIHYQVKAALGSIGYLEKFNLPNDETEERWKMVGNAIYIGEHKGGSALLVAAASIADDSGKVDLELKKKLKLRFGATVSDLQNLSNERRVELFLSEAEFIIHDKYVPAKNLKSGEKRLSIALILLPYTLDNDFQPIRLIRGNEYLPIKTPYKTFGHGSDFDEGRIDPKDPKAGSNVADATPYDIAKSSGFLRWAPLMLESEWRNQSLFRTLPLSEEDFRTHYNRIELPEDYRSFVDGPCANDLGAPLVLVGGVLPRPNETLQSARQLVLVGTFNAKSGTCERRGKKDEAGKVIEPTAVYLDLRDPEYQNFIRKHVNAPAKPAR